MIVFMALLPVLLMVLLAVASVVACVDLVLNPHLDTEKGEKPWDAPSMDAPCR